MKKKPMLQKHLLWMLLIQNKCQEDGDCLIWQGATDDAHVPQMRLPGSRKVYAARRVLLEALGKPPQKGHLATTKCDNPLCMAEEHVVLWQRSQLQRRSGKKIAASPLRAYKLQRAHINNGRSKFNPDLAREIRAQGMDWREIMKQYGCSESTAYDLLAGRHWKDHSANSPFTGLLTLAQR